MKTRNLVRCALIGAVYTVLCLALQPISYGLLNVRLAEMLTLLPVLGAGYIGAVTLGCFLANLLGAALGVNLAIDVLFGTLATFLGCLLTYALRRPRIMGLALPAALPPVLCNAVIIGLELTLFFTEGALTWPVLALNMLNVGIGEVISCCILGTALVRLIETNPRLRALFAGD